MPLLSLEDFKSGLQKNQRLLGLDLGDKTIGLALSDSMLMVASPYDTIRRTKFKADARALMAVIDEYQVQGLVLGYPLNMDGSEGPRCQATRQFATNFLSQRDTPILLWDERLSTKAVEGAMLEFDLSRAKRAQKIDKAAASFILQGFLDGLRF